MNHGTKENRREEVRLIVSNQDESEIKRSIPTTNDVSGWSDLDGIMFSELENENVSMIIGSDVPEAH